MKEHGARRTLRLGRQLEPLEDRIVKLPTPLAIIFALVLSATLLAAPPNDPDPTPVGSSTRHKVKVGETHTNTDDATVEHKDGSKGKVYIDPKAGTSSSETHITLTTRAKADVSGLDANDTVDCSGSVEGTISGEGGTVNLQGGCVVTVTNTSTTPGQGGSHTITVNLPSGGEVSIGPGSSATFKL